jgi:dCMP deaminase
MAALVATFSKDPSTQVGCVIADDQNRIVSLGYNGFPRGATDDERLHDRAKKYSMIIHAEENAVLNASRNLKGCSAFLTHPPCSHCIGVLSQVGISRVVFEEPSKDFKSRWNFEEILNYLIEVNIEASSYRRV